MSEVAQSVQFAGAGSRSVSSRLHVPAGHPRAWAVFAHCVPEQKQLGTVPRIAEALAERGIGVIRVDCSELEARGEDAAEDAMAAGVQDVVASADYLASSYQAPQILVGHGVAGAAVLQAAGRLGGVRAVATIGAPAGGRGVLEALPSMQQSFLFCHAPRDEVVAVDSARRLFEAATHSKSFVSLDDADHLLSRPADADYTGAVIAAWASRYLHAAPEADAEEAIENQVVVRGGPQGLAQDIRSGHYRLRSDEPKSAGGTGTGPGPYDLLLSALGSCSAMTVRLYADRKGWPVDSITITLDHARRHVDDCRECDGGETKKLDHIDKGVTIEGDLTDEQRARLVEISDKCPVHRTLQSEIRIETKTP